MTMSVFLHTEIRILFHKGTHSLYTSATDTLKLKQKSIPMQDEDLSIGYGSGIKLKNNADLDFNETHLCFVYRSNFWLSSAHSV